MEYDFRKRSYDADAPSYGRHPSSAAPHSAYAQHSSSLYSKIGAAGPHPPFPHAPSPPTSGMGIRVAIKPEYRITPPRNVLMEAVKENPNWGRLGIEYAPPKATKATPSYGPAADPVVSKYIAAGLSREAVPLAIANYGDNPTKVKEFSNGITLLREMGFPSNSIAHALIMYDNDTDKALAQFINAPP